MKNEKITLIGGGSLLWAPKLLGDFVLTDELQESQMCLHDIDEKALTFVYHLGKKITGEAKKEFHLTSTTSLEEALADASYVILCIAVGGSTTMRYDLEIPLRYGIYQSVGDTVVQGG